MQWVHTCVAEDDLRCHFLALSDFTQINVALHLYDRRLLALFYGEVREVLADISREGELVVFGEVAFAVDHDICLYCDRTVQWALGSLQGELQLASLFRTYGSQCHVGFDESVVLAQEDLDSHRLVGLVSIFDLEHFVLPFQHGTEVQRFLLQTQFAHFHWILVNGLCWLRNHFALDIEFGGWLCSIAGDGDGLLEASRTTAWVVCDGDLTYCTWLDRFACPFGGSTTATGAYITEYERGHTFVSKFENGGYAAVCFVDLAEIVGRLVKSDYWCLTESSGSKQ